MIDLLNGLKRRCVCANRLDRPRRNLEFCTGCFCSRVGATDWAITLANTQACRARRLWSSSAAVLSRHAQRDLLALLLKNVILDCNSTPHPRPLSRKGRGEKVGSEDDLFD